MAASLSAPQSFVPTAYILPLMEDRFMKGRTTDPIFIKVRGHIQNYAESLGITPNKLMVKDVYDLTGEIHPKLFRYTESIPRLPKQTVERWKTYQGEIRANIRNLSKKLYGVSRKKGGNRSKENILLKRVPDAMRIVLPYLPRENRPDMADSDKRLKAPLMESGVTMLSALLNVWERYELTTCEELFIDHASDIVGELKELSPSPQIRYMKGLVRHIRELSGFRKPRAKGTSLAVEMWPPTLRREWGVYERTATQRPSPGLVIAAKAAKCSAKKVTQGVVDRYRRYIGWALWVIRPEGDLGILDLIKLVPRENLNPDDDIPKEHNNLVDLYRASEQAKKGRRKGVGYDSNTFRQFVAALKGVAVRNGYYRYVKRFSDAYKPCHNDEAKEGHKRAKKEGIPISWVDGQINQLNQRFLRIVRTGSFKATPGRLKQSRRDLLLVMFFAWLVTLRYMGYRQQCMVSCVVGENFILNPDGSITLRFDKTKNMKRIRMELNESRRGTHGLLWDTLTLYYKKVYPYLVKESGNKLRGRLFVSSAEGYSFKPFANHTRFHDQFERCRDLFMDIDGLARGVRLSFHPHFLRGLCTDWMVLVLKMTCDQAAEVLGINTSVLKKEYLQQDREHDAGPMFDIVNARQRAEQSEGELTARINNVLAKVDKTQEKIVAEKDRQIAALKDEVDTLLARLDALQQSEVLPTAT